MVDKIGSSSSSQNDYSMINKEQLAKRLKAQGVPDAVIQQGSQAANKFLEDQKNTGSIFGTVNGNNNQNSKLAQSGGNDPTKFLKSLGVPDDVIKKGPKAVDEFLKGKAGIGSNNQSNSSVKDDFAKKLMALGIPKATIDKGKDAVKTYADKHHIPLPEPPKELKNNSTQNASNPFSVTA
ncbi:MAG: hypothetical protein WCK67_07110 [bacterium]